MGDSNQKYEPENSSAPQNFVLRCKKCRWARMTSGLADDLKDLFFIKPTSASSANVRKYRCPKCGTPCLLVRVKGNT